MAKSLNISWWAREDSNLQPSGYEPLALTIELRAPERFLADFSEMWRRECAGARQARPSGRAVRLLHSAFRAGAGKIGRTRFTNPRDSVKRCQFVPPPNLPLRAGKVGRGHRASSKPSGFKQALYACKGLHMLPNFRFLFCGVVFGLLLFAVTGAGVMLPDSHTRVGEMPEIGRPMMRQAIAEEPAPPQFYTMTLARRSEELERLRERASLEVAFASAPKELDLPRPNVTANSGALAEDVEAPIPQRDRTASTMSETMRSGQIAPAETGGGARPDDTDTGRTAASQRIYAQDHLNVSTLPRVKIPLPPSRRTGRPPGIHRRAFHRKHRVA
jgi:hypothetical protein